ncbi:hypothetical protein [Xylanimonas sp. McL0601]|uniref:hypothetical protein n=1 Tax=Xylanimonas sp. McL0601 TaxID=3414739 RepID=UPI003CFA2259
MTASGIVGAEVVPRLLGALDAVKAAVDGPCLGRDGHPQRLVAAVPRDALASVLASLQAETGSVQDHPVRRLAALLRPTDVPEADVDTWDDLTWLEAATRKGTT